MQTCRNRGFAFTEKYLHKKLTQSSQKTHHCTEFISEGKKYIDICATLLTTGFRIVRENAFVIVGIIFLQRDGKKFPITYQLNSATHVAKEVSLNTLGEKLQVARRIRGLTMQDVADELGFSRRTVSRWEHNEGTPHPVHARLIESASNRWLREAAGM